jgi:hypothetical protein
MEVKRRVMVRRKERGLSEGGMEKKMGSSGVRNGAMILHDE